MEELYYIFSNTHLHLPNCLCPRERDEIFFFYSPTQNTSTSLIPDSKSITCLCQKSKTLGNARDIRQWNLVPERFTKIPCNRNFFTELVTTQTTQPLSMDHVPGENLINDLAEIIIAEKLDRPTVLTITIAEDASSPETKKAMVYKKQSVREGLA